MEFEFDKEMDAILRRARRGDEVVTSFDAHLDADEISAFAENAVSDAARQRFTAHLADCTRCRKILSNVIVFNSEAETETASSAVSVETVETNVPWYRGFFAFPQLAYAMGAMVLLFSGFFGYLILQNMPGAGGSEVSYSTNTNAAPAMEKSAPASNSTVFSAANANTATNSTVQTNTSATTSNSAPVLPSNSSVSATPSGRTSALSEATPVNEVQPMATPAAKPETRVADNAAAEDDKNAAKVASATPTDQPSAAGATRQERDREDSSSKDDQKKEALSEQKLKAQRSMPQTPKKQISKPGDTRSVGGKTFNNVGGIWFDSALGKQKQKIVNRGTREYQKLDAGLRSIADNLGGTVVILWNGKAYRIQ